MPGRFRRSLDAMDANSADPDRRRRLSTPARSDYAYWDTLLAGTAGWAVFGVCVCALAALLVWLFA